MAGRDLMRAFLAEARREPESVMIALDVDGTVSDIAPSPGEAFVSDEVREAVERVAQRYRVWFLSGRDADKARTLVGASSAGYVGAHGLEALDRETVRTLTPLEEIGVQLDLLALAVATDVPEVARHVERKRWSVAFHYRMLPESPTRLRASIGAHLTPALAVHEGKRIFEIGPAVQHNKGTALAWLVDLYRPRRVLVAGDDLTDVSMFRTLAERRQRGEIDGVAVGVLQPGETPDDLLEASDTAVDGVAGLHRLLLELLLP